MYVSRIKAYLYPVIRQPRKPTLKFNSAGSLFYIDAQLKELLISTQNLKCSVSFVTSAESRPAFSEMSRYTLRNIQMMKFGPAPSYRGSGCKRRIRRCDKKSSAGGGPGRSAPPPAARVAAPIRRNSVRENHYTRPGNSDFECSHPSSPDRRDARPASEPPDAASHFQISADRVASVRGRDTEVRPAPILTLSLRK
ncbi:hypothetical protein EVAR_14372_1 [Eumeta japonica]|uniref:Uncharacterized protein n=1 Tax=Eumeta variegata TaxID=151549 RepID=A0A4C1TX47_EUMVA|nr:hypothetical protein EVAR_14372_1 [Eumeta japonica]